MGVVKVRGMVVLRVRSMKGFQNHNIGQTQPRRRPFARRVLFRAQRNTGCTVESKAMHSYGGRKFSLRYFCVRRNDIAMMDWMRASDLRKCASTFAFTGPTPTNLRSLPPVERKGKTGEGKKLIPQCTHAKAEKPRSQHTALKTCPWSIFFCVTGAHVVVNMVFFISFFSRERHLLCIQLSSVITTHQAQQGLTRRSSSLNDRAVRSRSLSIPRSPTHCCAGKIEIET